MAYINKKELDALHIAWETCNTTLESSTADENSEFVKDMISTLKGLSSLIRKASVGKTHNDVSALPIPDVSLSVCACCNENKSLIDGMCYDCIRNLHDL